MTFKRKTPEEIFAPFGGVSGIKKLLQQPSICLFGDGSLLSYKELSVIESLIKGETLQVIAWRLGISRQRVHQIEKAAIAKLIEYIKE